MPKVNQMTDDRLHKQNARQIDRKKGKQHARRGAQQHDKKGLSRKEAPFFCICCARKITGCKRSTSPDPMKIHRQFVGSLAPGASGRAK
jgi:hypothetical protein